MKERVGLGLTLITLVDDQPSSAVKVISTVSKVVLVETPSTTPFGETVAINTSSLDHCPV